MLRCVLLPFVLFGFRSCRKVLVPASGSGRVCRLDQEPPSGDAVHRANLDRLRDIAAHEHAPWPTLPAADQAAGPHAYAQDGRLPSDAFAVHLNFVILTPGYTPEMVPVPVQPPAEIEDALQLLQQERDQVQARVYPVLTPARPMPTPNYAVVLAMPAWATTDVCLCFDLQEVDGRLYADIGPTSATRAVLLQLVGLTEEAQVDVYLGASAVPIQDTETVDLLHGHSLFFTPRHELPGAYYYLEDVLLSSYAWDGDVVLPGTAEDPVLCVVTETGPRLVDFPDEASIGSPDILSRALGIPANRLCLQPAVPRVMCPHTPRSQRQDQYPPG